ncbi:MAG: hypothetical protein RJA66_122 [Actinomycetota bacterium]|jgi:hypothetical protein
MVEWSFLDSLAAQEQGCKLVDFDSTNPKSKREWCLNGKAIAWERPLSTKDMLALGDKAPKGRVLAVHMPDMMTRDAWIQTVPVACFVSAHFASYPAVLIDLELADEQLVREVFADGVAAALA